MPTVKLPTDAETYLDERCASFEEGYEAGRAAYLELRPHLLSLLAAVLDGAGDTLGTQRAALAISDILNEHDN